MLQSLQTRLSLSHLLPIIFLIILVAFGFLHVARTDAFIAPRVQQMMADATMIGEVLLSEEYDWSNRSLANLLVKRLQPKVPADLALLDSHGELLDRILRQRRLPSSRQAQHRSWPACSMALPDG